MANVPAPSLFYGNSTENPQNFLREAERYIQLNRIPDEATKVIIFSTFISAGSEADIWWTTLNASHKQTWAAVKTAFEAEWPAIVVAKKSKLDHQKELLALRLKDEDVGERIMVAGVSTWSHLHYHSRLQKLVQDAGVAQAPVFIHQVREALPRVIRDLTSPAPADWNAFLAEISNADIHTIQDKARREKERKEVEKGQNARIARLEGHQRDPVEILRLQMQRASIASVPATFPQPRTTGSPGIQRSQSQPHTIPSTTTTRRQIRYVAANQALAPQRPRGQPPTQEERDALRACISDLPHHQGTDAGQAAYEEQLRQWAVRWGEGTRCTENTPFPLTPGTAQICSGECFRCGAHGHISPACPLPPDAQLPKNETIWRSICMRTLGTFNRAAAPQISINFVTEDVYTPGEWDQGNGNGSLV